MADTHYAQQKTPTVHPAAADLEVLMREFCKDCIKKYPTFGQP